jgi:hypothetical protein
MGCILRGGKAQGRQHQSHRAGRAFDNDLARPRHGGGRDTVGERIDSIIILSVSGPGENE